MVKMITVVAPARHDNPSRPWRQILLVDHDGKHAQRGGERSPTPITIAVVGIGRQGPFELRWQSPGRGLHDARRELEDALGPLPWRALRGSGMPPR
jgi:hypothetical protein